MAIRLRQVSKNQWIALCAARSVAKDGDIYLDDAQHQALNAKFARESNASWDLNLPYNDAELDYLVEQEEGNNSNRILWEEIYNANHG